MVRSKIQASMIVRRLSRHVAGKLDLSPTQIAAARILLDKSVPSLSSTELTGADEGPLQVAIVRYSPPQ